MRWNYYITMTEPRELEFSKAALPIEIFARKGISLYLENGIN